jgi:hypothetical protein
MFTAYVLITLLAAAANVYGATVDFARSEWILVNMTKYGVPHSWLQSLGAAKALGALGLLVGIVIPPVGLAAAVGLTLYFVGALGTVLRARVYADFPYPGGYLLLAVASLVLRLASL